MEDDYDYEYEYEAEDRYDIEDTYDTPSITPITTRQVTGGEGGGGGAAEGQSGYKFARLYVKNATGKNIRVTVRTSPAPEGTKHIENVRLAPDQEFGAGSVPMRGDSPLFGNTWDIDYWVTGSDGREVQRWEKGKGCKVMPGDVGGPERYVIVIIYGDTYLISMPSGQCRGRFA